MADDPRQTYACNEHCPRYAYRLKSPCLFGFQGDISFHSQERFPFSKVMIVGQDPGQDEDRLGKVFVGRAGKLLNEILVEVGQSRDAVYITNSVKCATPGTNVTPGKVEIECCRKHLVQEIKEIQPQIILALGSVALYAVLLKEGVTKHLNQVLFSEEFNTKVIPVYHPAYILRDESQRPRLVDGFRVALAELVHPASVEKKDETRYLVVQTEEQAEKVFRVLEGAQSFSVDTETTSLSFVNSKILCIQFSWRAGFAVVFPWEFFEDYSVYKDRLKLLLATDKPKYLANAKFDIQQGWAQGIDIKGPHEDVCLKHSLVDDNMEHGLDVLTMEYAPEMGPYWLKMDNWKKEYCRVNKIKIKEEFTYSLFPRDMLYEYGAKDADATFRVEKALEIELLQEGTDQFYRTYSIPFMPVLAEMEYRGVLVDRDKIKKIIDRCEFKLNEYSQEIQTFAEVKQYETWRHKAELRKIVFGYKERYGNSKTLKSRWPVFADYAKSRAKKLKPFVFNQNSSDQLQELFYTFMGITSPYVTKKGKPSAGKEALVYFESQGVPLAGAMMRHRRLAHMLSQFLLPIYTKSALDGRIHTEYVQADIVTGRLSSRKPNMQNPPRLENTPTTYTKDEREEYKQLHGEYPLDTINFKDCLLADPGFIFVRADLAQAEFRMWANYSGDEDMIADIINGLDIHSRTAQEVWGLSLEEWKALPEVERKRLRNDAKSGVFGMMYGMGAKKLAKDKHIELSQAEAIIRAFTSRYPVAVQWLQNQIRFARSEGYVQTFMGRKRRLPNINHKDSDKRSFAERQARNSPIQGAASDMNNHYMRLTLVHCRAKGIEIYPALSTHDEDCLQTREQYVEPVVATLEVIVATEFPELRCPMKLEFKVGTSIGGAVDLEKYLKQRKAA